MRALLHAVAVAIGITCTRSTKPHIVFVLVDDWGWNNVGYHRPNDPEVQTPNVDRLVKLGIELDRHYVYMWCAPSRASLQSGRLPVHVHFTSDPFTSSDPSDPVAGFSGIPRNMTGIAEHLRAGGYRTHATGKWDAGMATWDHTPMGRGYETFFGYFGHANDYWTQQSVSSGPNGCNSTLVDLWNNTGPARGINGSGYEEVLFLENTMSILDRHVPSEPLFLFHAFHQIHTPLQVPAAWEKQFDFLKNADRRKYAAMVKYMDTSLGKIVSKLQAKGMWENTLMVVVSDNGGPTYYMPGSESPDDDGFGGASNAPLRGGKFTDWEGGVRVNAFITGGAVPSQKRGTVLNDYIHMSDWYTTFAKIAGVDPFDHKAAKAGLPPIDGVDHSDLILGRAPPGTGNRTEIHHSVMAVTRGKWKLITGGLEGMLPGLSMGEKRVPWSGWGPGYGQPQGIINDFTTKDCGKGCLYDIQDDPTERRNVAWRQPAVLKEMKARLDELNLDVFVPKRGALDPRACVAWDGFFGPWIDVPTAMRPAAVDMTLV